MNRQKLRVSIDLLTGYMIFRAHVFKLGLAERKKCQLYREEQEDSMLMSCLIDKEIQILEFLNPSDLNEARINSLYSLANYIGFGLS